MLSHDLLEGSYLRCALCTDILVLDGYPAKYNSFITRLSRWTRGDWQIARWLRDNIVDKNGKLIRNPLGTLSKFKILDNLRRSIVPAASLLAIVLGICSVASKITLPIGIISAVMPSILEILNKIIFKKELEADTVMANRSFIPGGGSITGSITRGILEIALLPYKAWILVVHIVKTVYRMLVSKQNLLEWMTAEEAEKNAKSDLASYYKQMYIQVILAVFIFLASGIWGNSYALYVVGTLLACLWGLAPLYAWEISKPIEKIKAIDQMSPEEKEHLREIAKRTWEYFMQFTNEENHYLPPDNYEEARDIQVASRTSPTNIGLWLLTIVSAYDFGFINKEEALKRISQTIKTIEELSKWNGHLYNWYHTKTLEPLIPRYISSVDSGNFVGYLYTLKSFLKKENQTELIKKVEKLIQETDFSKLYSPKQRLFSIGYNIEESKLTDCYYDLLASEARQTSLVAIAKRDVPAKHWASLGRTLTVLNKYKGLVSWSGTAFEYLMSNITMPEYEGSLLDESCKFMIMCQKEYCKKLGIPWGISEAAFALKDLNGNYQYKAFGIPWLGLKRGLADEKVVSSYGSMMAIFSQPRDVIENLKLLEKEKMLGTYGLYESIDYTPGRLKKGKSKEVVKTYMAHHQGLILLSLGNLFFDNIFQKRFMENPEIEAVDILLQERMPKEAILTKEKKEKVEKLKPEDYESYSQREYATIEEHLLRSNVIASDNYMVYLDDRGTGFSKYKNMLINKFKETADYEQGIFFYLKNIKNKRVWSNAALKTLGKADRYKITFSSDSNQIDRIDGNIESKTKITVVPNEATEIRRLYLKNNGPLEETLEVSSFLEPVLSEKNQEEAHPTFNNLFLKYEWQEDKKIMIIQRNARLKSETPIYLAASFYCESETIRRTGI